jgi:hypothetical protein
MFLHQSPSPPPPVPSVSITPKPSKSPPLTPKPSASSPSVFHDKKVDDKKTMLLQKAKKIPTSPSKTNNEPEAPITIEGIGTHV